MNIYQSLLQKNKPIFILAPMEDVTDTVFRQIIIQCGPPDLLFTEFTNVEGITSEGVLKIIHRLKYNKQVEKPIIAQIWGITPQDYYKACKVILELGFDGVDINMGCPVKNVIKQGACSALINNRPLALEIIQACKSALGGKIPLSIKTRIGFNKIQTDDWITFVLKELRPDALTIHARTVKEESKVPNHFDEYKKIKDIYNEIVENEVRIFKSITRGEKINQICNILA